MDYMTLKEAAEKWGVTPRRVGGGNLHRTPFGGRNGEYFSEDAVQIGRAHV